MLSARDGLRVSLIAGPEEFLRIKPGRLCTTLNSSFLRNNHEGCKADAIKFSASSSFWRR